MNDTGTRSLVPIVRWARSYRRADMRFDLIAGVTVSALVVPKALGYAGIAGVPIERGLYAAAAGCLIYAVFGTSRQISTGPSSALAAIAASAAVISGVAVGQQTADLVVAITLLTGLLFVAAAVLKLGWLSRLLSKAVITGFLFGAAIDVVIGELPKLTGTSSEGENSWRELISWVQGLGDIQWLTLVVGAGSPGRRADVARGRSEGARRARARRRRTARLPPVRSRRPRRGDRRRGATWAAGTRAAAGPSRRRALRHHRRRCGRAVPHRLLPDGRRRPAVRRPASLPDRCRPGDGRPGHVQHRRRRVPGDAGVDQPVGQFVERLVRGAHAARLDRHRGRRRSSRW